VLRVENASVRFGGVQALDGVSLVAPGGVVTGLIGPNGAGKTTLFNAVTGLLRLSQGSVWLDETEVTRYGPTRRARLGLARTFQRLEVFGTMTARQNILVAAELAGHRGTAASPAAATSALLGRLGLTAVADVQADTLPTGLARLVELARALASQPSVLLLDEPSSGLNTAETDSMGELLGELADEGLAVLLVEHDVELVMRVCRTVSVLDFGRLIAVGSPAAVQADPGVRLAYLGTEAHVSAGTTVDGDAPANNATETGGAVVVRTPANATEPFPPPALELRNIHAGYGPIEVLHGVDIRVSTGAVFALLGANGAGKSSTIRVASGRLRPSTGDIRFAGESVTGRSPQRLARMGLCTVPEGRAVFPNLTVAENLQMWTFKDGTAHAVIE
jgi:branched-chain amino acid transport system ATP-binding protein